MKHHAIALLLFAGIASTGSISAQPVRESLRNPNPPAGFGSSTNLSAQQEFDETWIAVSTNIHEQKSFIQDLRRGDWLRETAEAFWEAFPNVNLPAGLFILRDDRYYNIVTPPSLEGRDYAGADTRLFPHEWNIGANRLEVDPVEAGGALRIRAVPSRGSWQAASGMEGSLVDERSDSAARPKMCSAAVQNLRDSVNSMNQIDHFDEMCLFTGGERHPRKLRRHERVDAASCLENYRRFAQHCFAGSANRSLLGAMWRRTGAVLRINKHGLRIACTALVVNDKTILTARHCFEDAQFGEPLETRYGTRWYFLRDAVPGSASYILNRGEIEMDHLDDLFPRLIRLQNTEDWQRSSVDTRGDHHWDEPVLVEMDQRISDYDNAVFGALENRLRYVEPNDVQSPRLNVIAFHRFVLRAFQLRARLESRAIPDHLDFVLANRWRSILAVDASPTCRISATRSDDNRYELAHFCQTHKRASGAPLFPSMLGVDFDEMDGFLPLFGVHVGGIKADDDGNSVVNSGVSLTPEWNELLIR